MSLLLKKEGRVEGFEKKVEKEIFVHTVNPSPNDWDGTDSWPVTRITNADECYFIFKVPDDFNDLVEAAIVLLPDTTEAIEWDVYCQAARAGDAEDRFTNNMLNETKNVTQWVIDEIDLLKGTPHGLFGYSAAGLRPNDYVAIWFASDTTELLVLGMRIKYT